MTECVQCFNRNCRSLEESRDELRMACLWPVDLEDHHYFLPCSSCSVGVLEGNRKETSTVIELNTVLAQ